MSEDLMDYNEEERTEETHTVHCQYCERDVVCASDTGEPILSESCSDMSCELLACARSGGDPEILNFHEDRGC